MKPTQEQLDNQKIIETVYTPAKEKIWIAEMKIIGNKWRSDEIDFEEYMKSRSKLRARLGYPA